MDWLVKGALALGAYLLADKVTKDVTGKHIHQHVFEWWCRIRDKINQWRKSNPTIDNVFFVGKIVGCVDGVASELKKGANWVTFKVFAASKNSAGQAVKQGEVTEEKVSLEELYEQFPHLRKMPSGKAIIIQV